MGHDELYDGLNGLQLLLRFPSFSGAARLLLSLSHVLFWGVKDDVKIAVIVTFLCCKCCNNCQFYPVMVTVRNNMIADDTDTLTYIIFDR